ncbi:MAG: hypothetical protein E3K37_03335 [Candidatus Kuenenia sp.]|nr:hypothetical protein [Candidatus Kuenenia hertensis]
MKTTSSLTFMFYLSTLYGLAFCYANEVKVGGTIESFSTVYSREATDSKEGQLFTEIRLLPTLTWFCADKYLFYLEGDIRQDTAGFAHGYINDFTENTGERLTVTLREGYWELNEKWLRIRAGKQVYDWSVTDAISPSDNISPRDWTDIIRSERIGVPSLDVRLGYDSYIQIVYIPLFSPSKLPVAGSRWERSLPPGLVNEEQERVSSDSGQFAVRAGHTWNGFDLGVSFFKGYGYSPSFKLEAVSTTETGLVPVYRSEEVFAASLAKEISGYTLRSEIGYFNQDKDDDFVQGVVGIDREWVDIFQYTDSLYILLQYANEVKTQGDNPVGFETIDFRRIFNNAIFGKVAYSFDDSNTRQVKLTGVYNISDRDSYIEPAVNWNKFNFNIEAGVNVMSGHRDTFFGGYSQNDRFFVTMTYQF